jgi:carbamate kinase
MRIVIAVGGNALLRRGDPMTTAVQRRNIAIAAEAIAPLAAEHSVVVVHGNGPQVGLLSLQAEAYKDTEPYPLDVLDAGTQGMIGYLIQQELRSLLPAEHQVATLLTMIVMDPDDPAFASPAKFVGPVYAKEAADVLAAEKGWVFRPDGAAWRRVVPSPEPRRILEIAPIAWLLERGAVLICAGGGGIPTMYPSSGPGALAGAEAVIDKDLASELLAEDIGADLFVMATDVDGVYLDWGSPEQRRLGRVTPEELAGYEFAARAQTVIVYVVLGILAFFSVVTLVNIHPSLLAFSGYPSFQDIISSVALTFFAFLGFGIITFTAKDLAKPSRQLPKAMFLALGIATVIYVAIALGVFGTLTVDKVISSGGPRSRWPPSRRWAGRVTG